MGEYMDLVGRMAIAGRRQDRRLMWIYAGVVLGIAGFVALVIFT